MSGAKPSHPLCAFMEWTGTAFKVKVKINIMLYDGKGRGKASPTHRPPLPPGNIPVTDFC
jgi:hypothetical protein